MTNRQFVRDSVGSVWDAIIFGLILSILILFFFLKNWGSVLTAIVTIPISVLITIVAMKMTGMSFNMMTLGGIAASIGLIIDNAIIVVEAMCHRLAQGRPRLQGIHEAMGEIFTALIGSTLTPVVVFLPLAYLNGMAGVFFRALGLTMVVSLLVSLALAVTLTPSLAAWLINDRRNKKTGESSFKDEGGFLLKRVLHIYETSVRWALRNPWLTLTACAMIFVSGIFIYRQLETDFLPSFDEGGFDMDFTANPGTSLTETSRVLDEAEKSITSNPDIEGYSRRLGTQLGPFITEPYTGDYLIKLKPGHKHSTEEVIDGLRHDFDRRFPQVAWDFHGFPGRPHRRPPDGARTRSEIYLYSPDLSWLEKTAPRIEDQIQKIPGIVDTFNGLTETGPSIGLHVRSADAARFGLTAQDISTAANTALIGQVSSSMLDGDRVIDIRVMADPQSINRLDLLRALPIRTPSGGTVRLDQVCDVSIQPSEVELDRDNLRQDVIITARLEGRDLGSAMRDIQATLAKDDWLPPGAVEYGGLYQQQQESFRNLVVVLLAAILLVFTVLLIEFRSFYEPVAIVFGSILALFGTVVALRLTGISLNIVSFLGAIIGVGFVA